jgi:site-specific recombinase XerD
MDRWAWEQLGPWLEIRRQLPIGALLCVIHGPTAGRRWEASAARKQLHHAAAGACVRRRFAPHQLRHAHAVEMAHEGVPLVVIQRQLEHANPGITSVYLQGIDSSEIISTVHGRPLPDRPDGRTPAWRIARRITRDGRDPRSRRRGTPAIQG